MKRLIVANWKLHPKTLPASARLLRGIARTAAQSSATAVFCPPTPFIAPLKKQFPRLNFGAQDAFQENEGPYTGAIGPAMLKSIGAAFVIVGHSERRATFGETDVQVAAKIKLVLEAGLTPILCIGEPLEILNKGTAAARAFVAGQLQKDIKEISKNAKVILAYEPVWAISTSGSGLKATPEDAADMIGFLKTRRPGPVLYGGSVDAKSAPNFLSYVHIDGLLVGRASLSAKEFAAILRHA